MDSPGDEDVDAAADAASLPELLRAWRTRVDPRTIVGLGATRRRSNGLTQRDVARLTGVSERWYGALERGKEAAYSADFLDRLSSTLRLSRAERTALYLRVVGHPPAPAAVPEAGAAQEVGEVLQKFLDSQEPNPAYVTDLAWNVVACNGLLKEWLPWAAQQGNQMRWGLLHPEAREQLVNWEHDWARPFLGQIRFERARHPRNEALRQLERDVLEGSPTVRKLWDRGEMFEHADGDVRRLRLPYHEGREVAVRLVILRPMRSDRLRVVVLIEEFLEPEDADSPGSQVAGGV